MILPKFYKNNVINMITYLNAHFRIIWAYTNLQLMRRKINTTGTNETTISEKPVNNEFGRKFHLESVEENER